MRLRKRYVAALVGVALLLFWAVKFTIEWRREFVSAAESVRHAHAALRAGDVERTVFYLDEAVSRSSLDQEELSSVIIRLLALLDGAPPMPLADAARLHRYRLELQRRNCLTQSWEQPLARSIEGMGLSREEARRRFLQLHPGWERIDACVAEAEMLDTFAAWRQGRLLGQELKRTAAVNETVHTLRALVNLKARELDALGQEYIPAAPIVGWARKTRPGQPDNPDLARVLTVGLAIAQDDERIAAGSLPRASTLAEAIALADEFAAGHPRSVSARVIRIETRVRAAELVALPARPTAQELLDEFADTVAGDAQWREVLRVANLQLRNLCLLDAGSGENSRGAATLRRLAGGLLDRDPGAPDAYLLLGRMCRLLGQEAEAREHFRQAAETPIQTVPSLRAMIWELAVGLAILEEVDLDLRQSGADLDLLDRRVAAAAVRLGDGQGGVQLLRGRIALRRGQQREGIRHLEEACKQLGKTRPEALFHSGMALAAAGETGIAAERLGIFLGMRGNDPGQNRDATRTLAGLLLLNLPANEAAQRLAELSARYPDDEELFLVRARAMLHATLQTNTDPFARAAGLETIRALLRNQIAAGREAALLQAAVAEALLSEAEGSLRALEAFCRANPRNEDGILAWCRALRQRGDTDGEERVVREQILPQVPGPLADLLRRALAREPAARDLLQPMLRLAFATDSAEQLLGLFWLHWSLGEAEACSRFLAEGLALRPDHPGFLAARIAFLLDTGEAAAARAVLDALPPHIPEWQRQVWQAKLLLAVRDFPAAEQVLQRLVARQPHLSEAMALQGSLARLQNRNAEARLRFRDSLQTNPRQILALEGIAEICLGEHEPVLAFGYLRQLVRLASPEQPRFEALLLDHLSRSGTAVGAIRFRNHRRQHAPWDRANRLELALLHLKSRQGGQAGEVLRRLHQEDAGDLAIAVLLARTLHEQGMRQDARELLVRVGSAAAADDGNLLEVAGQLAACGAVAEARELFAKAAAGEGGPATAARFRLAELLYAEGNWAEAAAAYGKCPAAESRPDLLLRQAECTIRAGQLPAAREFVATLRRLVPDYSLVAVLEAELALAEGDGAQAAAFCERALALDPGCAAAYLLRAQARLRAGVGEEVLALACKDLENACIHDAKLTAARELLVRLQLERERPDEAVAGLQLLVGARPGEHRFKLTLARLLLALGRQAALGSQLKTWRDQYPGETFVWGIEGLLAKAQGDERGAARAFARHAAETGEPESVLAAVDAFLACGMPAEARQLCATFDGAPASPEILLARARLAPPAEARDFLARAFALVRDDAAAGRVLEQARLVLAPPDLLVWLAEWRGKTPSRGLCLALVRLREEQGQPQGAAELLHTLAGESAGEERAFLLSRAAAAELAAGETARAEGTLRQALELVPGHPLLLNNAAHLALTATGREAEAVHLARQAVAASAANRELHAGSLATLAEALFALRLYDQARDALLQALAIRETPEERLLLGRALLASGWTTQGNAQLRRAKELAEREGKGELARRIGELL